jgi:WD40 repeat protein
MQNEKIVEWSIDAGRFLKLHWNIIRENPLSVYHIFVFSPRSSIFYKIYATSGNFPRPEVVMGHELEWPSEVVAQTHELKTSRLSPCGLMLATGGNRNNSPVFAVWDVRTADSTMVTHPCRTDGCTVLHVSFEKADRTTEMKTSCQCGTIYKWTLSSYPFSILSETRFDFKGRFDHWSDTGVITLFSRTEIENSDESGSMEPYSISSAHTPNICHVLQNGLGSKQDQWLFSPGNGDKVVVGTSGDSPIIALWSSSTGSQLFMKSLDQGQCLTRICFSPDSASVLYGVLKYDNLSYSSINLISQAGSMLWTYEETMWINDFTFFPDGTKILICFKTVIRTVDTYNRDTLIEVEWEDMGTSEVSISPDCQKFVLLSERAVEIFDDTLHCLEQHSVSMVPDWFHYSWTCSTLLAIDTQHEVVSFHDLYLSRNHFHKYTFDVSTLKVTHILLSPDSRYILTLHHNGSLSLWKTESGNKVHLSGDMACIEGNASMKYSSDSSKVIVWNSSMLSIVEIGACRIEHLPSPHSRIVATTPLPGSNGAILILEDGSIQKFSSPYSNVVNFGKLSLVPRSVRQLIVSPTEQFFVVIGDHQLVLQKRGNEITRAHSITGYFYGVVFAHDESHFFSARWESDGLIISRTNSFQKYLDEHPVYRFDVTSCPDRLQLAIIKRDQRRILSISNLPGEWHGSTKFLDCADGKEVILPIIHGRYQGQLLYGNFLMCTLYSDMHYSSLTSNNSHIAFINSRHQVVVVNCSTLIAYL